MEETVVQYKNLLEWKTRHLILYFQVRISNLNCLNSPGTGDETVSGVFRIASFDILLGFFNAHVNPYEPTRNPFEERMKACETHKLIAK